MERKAKAATQTGVYLAIVAAILVVANVISYSAYKRFDLTKNERFTLSKGSAHLVREGLKQDLQVDIYVTRGLPKHEAFIQDLTDLMGEYEQASNGKLHYTIIEPKTDEQRAAAKEAGLQEAAFGEGSETGQDQATITRGFMGVSFKYGSEKEAIPILSPDQSQGLEFWITNKIRELRDRADNINQTFGIVTGKDEIKLSEANLIASQGGRPGPNMKGILEQALPFYKFEDVDLKGGDAEINKDLVGIVITQPGKEFTEKELRRIDQFLMLGNKALAVFAGAVNIKASDPAMKATLNTWGLEKLLEGYGVEMKKEAVLDWSRSMALPVQTQSGQLLWFRAPGILQLQEDSRLDEKEQLLDTAFPGFFRLAELAFPFPSTLVPHPEKQPEATVKVVARSTPNTTVDTAETIDMKIRSDWAPKGERAQRAIGVTVEGKLKSAFGGQEGLGITAPGESASPSRVLVVSASQFLANPFARAGNPPPMPPQMAMMGGMGGDEDLQMLSQPYAQKYLTNTILALKNTLDWMAGDSTLLAASAKLLGETNLTYSDIEKPKQEAEDDEASLARKAEEYRAQRKSVQTRVQWTLTLLPAALFAAFGLVRWRRRESARENIKLD
ncbi:GldG family protein [Sorangium sp. So ce131]|uniref:GldG family protein n=1 Tax=Sorangium sp. So ce131 TaxID=3133282 RepID=UPI003F5E69FF